MTSKLAEQHGKLAIRALALGTLGGALALGTGCAGDQQPRMRLGSIPFPGTFTLYAVADPSDLGTHRYEGSWDKHDGPDEVSRGIMYTSKAGFLDLSHIRESMDIVKYTHGQIAGAMGGATTGSCAVCAIDWSDCRYGVSFCPPEWWGSLDAAEKSAMIEEASIRQAQRMAIVIGTWHEIGTWWGQETVPPFSEKNSALTWDDTTSHVVAAIVAGMALRDKELAWNAAVTKHLGEELAELGVVDTDCEAKAVEAVHGRWWWNGTAIRRDLDTGIATNVKTPWLAPGVPCCAQGAPMALPLPDLSDVRGHDLRAAFELHIQPDAWMIRKALGCEDCPEEITSENQILMAIEHLRGALREEFGPVADNPDAPPTRGETTQAKSGSTPGL